MVNHGIATGLLFLVVGMLTARGGSRLIGDYGGVWKVAPILGGVFLVASLATIAMPGTNSFISEFLVLIGTFTRYPAWAVIATVGIVLAAVYMLWIFQRMMTGPVRGGAAVLRTRRSRRPGIEQVAGGTVGGPAQSVGGTAPHGRPRRGAPATATARGTPRTAAPGPVRRPDGAGDHRADPAGRADRRSSASTRKPVLDVINPTTSRTMVDVASHRSAAAVDAGRRQLMAGLHSDCSRRSPGSDRPDHRTRRRPRRSSCRC